MSDFLRSRRVRSLRQRTCPECLAGIGIGQAYRKEVGAWDGDFTSAIMCEPCAVFRDRYVASMQFCSERLPDEVCYTYGQVINEAAEFVGYDTAAAGIPPLPVRREAVHAMFDAFDDAELAHQERERTRRRDDKRRLELYAEAYYASINMVRGMSAAGGLE